MVNHLLYWVPTTKGMLTTPDWQAFCKEHGLWNSVGKQCIPVTCFVHGGPDGQTGHVVVAKPTWATDKCMKGFEVGYYPDVQHWESVEYVSDMPRTVWLGYYTNRPRPSGSDLARRNMENSYTVVLLDDEEWLVPVIRIADRSILEHIWSPHAAKTANEAEFVAMQLSTLSSDLDPAFTDALPKALKRSGGQFCEEPLAKYAHITEVAVGFWRQWWDEKRISMDRDTLFPVVAEALSLNYRVGEHELSVLRLLNESKMNQCLLMMIDHPAADAVLTALAEAQKKTWYSSSMPVGAPL